MSNIAILYLARETLLTNATKDFKKCRGRGAGREKGEEREQGQEREGKDEWACILSIGYEESTLIILLAVVSLIPHNFQSREKASVFQKRLDPAISSLCLLWSDKFIL